jgi:hypothetical protein
VRLGAARGTQDLEVVPKVLSVHVPKAKTRVRTARDGVRFVRSRTREKHLAQRGQQRLGIRRRGARGAGVLKDRPVEARRSRPR